MSDVNDPRRARLEQLDQEFTPEERAALRRMLSQASSDGPHCTGASCGSLAGCAIMCGGLTCPDFVAPPCGPGKGIGVCPAQVRCDGGFSCSSPKTCGPLEIVGI